MKKKTTKTKTPKPIKHKMPGKKQAPLYKIENMNYYLSNGNATAVSIERFADEQLEYILQNEHVLHINKFYLSKGLRRDLYYRWTQKSAYLKKIHDLCMEILGLRREEKMAQDNSTTLKHTLHMYSHDWAIADKYHDQRKQAEEDKTANIKVIVQKPEEVIDRNKYKPIKPKENNEPK